MIAQGSSNAGEIDIDAAIIKNLAFHNCSTMLWGLKSTQGG